MDQPKQSGVCEEVGTVRKLGEVMRMEEDLDAGCLLASIRTWTFPASETVSRVMLPKACTLVENSGGLC